MKYSTQTLKSFIYNNDVFCLYTLDGCESLYHKIKLILKNQSRSLFADTEVKHINDLKSKSYVVVKNTPSLYFIDKRIIPEFLNNTIGHKVLVKMAMVSNYIKDNEEFVKFIYTTDKAEYQALRGVCSDTYDRFDTFDCRYENRKTGDDDSKKVIRHFGTKHGIIAYQKSPKVRKRKKSTREDTRNENNIFIRVLMNGPQFSARPLIDPFTKSNIESITVFNDLDERNYTINTYTLHHCLYVNSTSVHKDGNEPSKALNTRSFTRFDTNTIIEFMGMIALGEDGHKIIHKTHYHDDIQGWFRRYLRGEVQWIPFHWKSEQNYRKTVNWILNHVTELTVDDFPSYSEFIDTLTFTDKHRKEIASTIGFSPISLNTITYNLE